MAPLPADARRVLRSYAPAIRHHLTVWLEAHMDAQGTTSVTLEDINVGVYKVLEALQNSMRIDTGDVEDLQLKLNDPSKWTSLEDYLSARRQVPCGDA